MNDQLQAFARSELKEGLSQCTDAQQLMFKRMYSHKNLDADINDIVDSLPEENLDISMNQVRRTLEKAKQLSPNPFPVWPGLNNGHERR